MADFEEVTAEAEALVEQSTGLRSLAGPARAQVSSRDTWIQANVSSFRRLLGPILQRAGKGGRSLPGFLGPAGRTAAGAEMGVVLGWMSGRVLGQYDLLFAEGDSPQDAVYYVGPNIVSLERRHGFVPHEFRLWIALHELTHRAQFTGVPWMRSHFLDLVERSVAIASPDPRQIMDALGRMAVSISSGRNPLAESGLVGGARLARAARDPAVDPGDDEPARRPWRCDDGPRRLGPGAERGALLAGPPRASRVPASGLTKFFQQLIGLEAKLRQYADGERFVREIERIGGPELLALAWQAPGNLPSAAEIQAPDRWASRVRGLTLEPA